MGKERGARKINILLVEDNPTDSEMTARALKQSIMGSCLYVVHDGEEALDFLFQRGKYAGGDSAPRPDIMLLDLNLPRITGHEVLKIVKQDKKLKLIPVIMMTTSSRYEDIIESYALGVNTFITKPVNFDDFLAMISMLENYWIGVARLPGE
ncbi:MAG: response regulator [Candidatus Omnitrophica bacterium]|nr:response regulator [Candidatus Omnitrophota bacterium]